MHTMRRETTSFTTYALYVTLMALLGHQATEAAPPNRVHITPTGLPGQMVLSWGGLVVRGAAVRDPPVNATSAPSLSRVRYGMAADALNMTATNVSRFMTTSTENISSYSYCGGATEVRLLPRFTTCPVSYTGLAASILPHNHASLLPNRL